MIQGLNKSIEIAIKEQKDSKRYSLLDPKEIHVQWYNGGNKPTKSCEVVRAAVAKQLSDFKVENEYSQLYRCFLLKPSDIKLRVAIAAKGQKNDVC